MAMPLLLCALLVSARELTEIPCKSPPRTKARLKIFKKYPSLSNNTIARVDKSAAISKAVLAIRLGEFTDYSLAARAHGCDHTAISRRVRGLTKTRKDINSFFHQCLTDNQEEVLIARINILTDRGMPPTSHIVRNLAEEIRGEPVGKNWTGQFIKRHNLQLKSAYL
jgi:Tc5 transposase DNA-binding domain